MELDFRKDPSVLATIVDEMAIGLFTVDVSGRFVAWSRGAERITGFRSEEVVGRRCELLEGPNCKGFSKLGELLQASELPPRGICHQECKVMSKDGRELYIHGNVRILTDQHGHILGAAGTFSDMTSFVLANEKIAVLQKHATGEQAFEHLLGKSQPMQEVFRQLKLAADSDVTVLITGDTGTGKELAAAAIHAHSDRRLQPFLAINCSAIPESLLESELFGHVQGAFTGAAKDKLGLLEAANGGTVFLDEIGDVSPAIQVKLLRVLQQREIHRVGDTHPRSIDVRVITATNRDLKAMLAAERIREDFYYRIHVFEIHMPPLRARREDIPRLVEHFITELGRAHDKPIDGIAKDALKQLMHYTWPGNVRELRNAIEHACVVASGDRISYLDLPAEVRYPQQSGAAAVELSQRQFAERERIVKALQQTAGNRTKAAELLGTSRVTLWKKMNRYAIEAPPDGKTA